MATISIPIDSELVGEMFLRAGKTDVDVGSWIEQVLADYLERTRDDGPWAEAYYKWREESADSEKFRTEFGDPKTGYRWGPLFLSNGTLIRMEYKRQAVQAVVKFDHIIYQGQSYTPSELASKIAAGTSRNAWRDLYVKRPSDNNWCLADELRRRLRSS
jgi:hypothetical protein